MISIKIKDVCLQTGLTDRAVRYYIEEKLISPVFSENYLGRRTFTFSETDISTLNEIVVLRKYGFTIAEIRDMYASPDKIAETVHALIGRKESAVLEEQSLLNVLSASQPEHFGNVNELVQLLSRPVEKLAPPPEDKAGLRSRVLRFLSAAGIFLVAWLPPLRCVFSLADRLRGFQYPVLDTTFLVLTLLSLLPSLLLIVFPRLHLKDKRRKKVKYTIMICCMISAVVSPFLSLGIISHSETTEIRNYRRLDPDCLANRIDTYQELFPQWPKYSDSRYLYRYMRSFDYTYDIYAEWPLPQKEFEQEVARASSVIAAHAPENNNPCNGFVKMQKGSYQCLILYNLYNESEPFEPVTSSYTYCIFAYNAEKQRVRYLFCDSLENGEDQPYYLMLDWE